jgi:hypothetical protein
VSAHALIPHRVVDVVGDGRRYRSQCHDRARANGEQA